MKKFAIKGTIYKPPYQLRNKFRTQVFIKRENIEREPKYCNKESFEFEVNSIVYPLGVFLIVEMEDCQNSVERCSLNDLIMELPTIKMLPKFQPDEMVQI